jgi:hypothetical protein
MENEMLRAVYALLLDELTDAELLQLVESLDALQTRRSPA